MKKNRFEQNYTRMISFIAKEPVVGLSTTLDEVFDSLDDHTMSKGDNLRIDNLKISSMNEDYSFLIDKYFIMKAYPMSMLATMLKSKGNWKDKHDIILPFDKDAIMSLEKYFKNSMWSDDENKKFGTEYATAVTVLKYLNMPLLLNSDMHKYVKMPIDYSNNCVSQIENKKLVIVSEIDGYWFDIEKDLLYKKYPDCLLSKTAKGPWLDRDEIILPFSKDILISLEYYLQIDSWIILSNRRSGSDLYIARDVLDYLMIHFNESIEYYEDIKNPYQEEEEDYELVEIEDDFNPYEEEADDFDHFHD
jgi:hypothetical protein